jgi:hypothetical protein
MLKQQYTLFYNKNKQAESFLSASAIRKWQLYLFDFQLLGTVA